MLELETEFFDLLETSESRWATLFIEGRTWFNINVQNLAWEAQINRVKASGARIAAFGRANSEGNEVSGAATDAEPRDHEETWRLWAAPGKRRAKFEVGSEPVDVVIEGSTFWSNGHGRSITNGGEANHSHGQGDGHNLIRTAEYAHLLHVVDLSDGTRIGRHTIDAKTTTVNTEHHEPGPGLHGLTIGDPEFLEMSVDRDRGVVLRASSWFQGAIYRVVEIAEVEFDPHFDPDVFEIEPGYGAEWILR
jgi:hypothetical protein